jgi:hypothetical protein
VRRDTAKLENASPYGSKPPAEISVAETAALVGLSMHSPHTYLGPREEARATQLKK